jgi:hypothetical protein
MSTQASKLQQVCGAVLCCSLLSAVRVLQQVSPGERSCVYVVTTHAVRSVFTNRVPLLMQVAVKAATMLPPHLSSCCLQALLMQGSVAGPAGLGPGSAADLLEVLVKYAHSRDAGAQWAQQLQQAQGLSPLAGVVSAGLIMPAADAEQLRQGWRAAWQELTSCSSVDSGQHAIAAAALHALQKAVTRILDGGQCLPSTLSAATAAAMLDMPQLVQQMVSVHACAAAARIHARLCVVALCMCGHGKEQLPYHQLAMLVHMQEGSSIAPWGQAAAAAVLAAHLCGNRPSQQQLQQLQQAVGLLAACTSDGSSRLNPDELHWLAGSLHNLAVSHSSCEEPGSAACLLLMAWECSRQQAQHTTAAADAASALKRAERYVNALVKQARSSSGGRGAVGEYAAAEQVVLQAAQLCAGATQQLQPVLRQLVKLRCLLQDAASSGVSKPGAGSSSRSARAQKQQPAPGSQAPLTQRLLSSDWSEAEAVAHDVSLLELQSLLECAAAGSLSDAGLAAEQQAVMVSLQQHAPSSSAAPSWAAGSMLAALMGGLGGTITAAARQDMLQRLRSSKSSSAAAALCSALLHTVEGLLAAKAATSRADAACAIASTSAAEADVQAAAARDSKARSKTTSRGRRAAAAEPERPHLPDNWAAARQHLQAAASGWQTWAARVSHGSSVLFAASSLNSVLQAWHVAAAQGWFELQQQLASAAIAIASRCPDAGDVCC